IEIGGLAAGSQFDRINVSGAASLAGTLRVSAINGFTPAVGDQFTFLTAASVSGTFTTLTLSGFPSGTQANLIYGSTSVTLRISAVPGGCSTCRGDLTGDGLTDAADVQAFVGCLFNNSLSGSCACADLNADG